MILRVLEQIWSEARTASPDRRALFIVAIASAVIAGAIAEISHPLPLIALATFTLVAAMQPATHNGLVVVVIVITAWLVTSDDPTEASAIGLSIALTVWHLSLALMAATPHSATLDRSILIRWAARGVLAGSAAAAVWLLVWLFDRRDATGSTVLTVGALLLVAVGAVATWSRSQGDDEGRADPTSLA